MVLNIGLLWLVARTKDLSRVEFRELWLKRTEDGYLVVEICSKYVANM